MRRASLPLVLALSVALAPRPAAAQDGEGEALRDARAALRRGDTELAIDILDEARETASDPALTYELYIAHEQAGDLEPAATHLEAYLAASPALPAEERAALEGHLAELRAALAPAPPGDPWADPAVGVIGWTLFAAGIVGIITFAASGAASFVLQGNRSEACVADASLCTPRERDPIVAAETSAWVGLGAGVLLGAIGGALLAVTGEAQRGATRALPPDLDPSMQRLFSVRPWVDSRGQGGAGLTVRVTF